MAHSVWAVMWKPNSPHSQQPQLLASVVLSDGKIIAAGEGGIVRFLPNGARTIFGIGGRIQYPFYARSVALQSNGSIIIGGGTLSDRSLDFVVSRYLNNGTLDTSFDADGHTLVSFGERMNVQRVWPLMRMVESLSLVTVTTVVP